MELKGANGLVWVASVPANPLHGVESDVVGTIGSRKCNLGRIHYMELKGRHAEEAE